jgi:hypothetical protein
VLGILLIGIIVISISFVSASWKDWFSFGNNNGGEGELASQQATAFVNVTSAQPPVIWFVSGLNDSTLLSSGVGRYLSFSFLACSPGGSTILPNAGNIATLVNGTFVGNYGTGANPKSTTAVSCSYVGEGSYAGTPGYCPSGISRNYSCASILYYYYDKGNWIINVSLRDTIGNLVINNTKTFAISSFKSHDTQPGYINWSSVTIGGSRSHSDGVFTVIDRGNENFNSTYPLKMNATKLANTTTVTGGPNPNAINYINAGNFSVSANNLVCASVGLTVLTQDTFIPLDSANFVIDHTLSTPGSPRTDTMDFCLESLTGIGTAAYATQSGNSWDTQY